jgi:hypothetical protein
MKMRMRRIVTGFLGALISVGCAASERAASQDPMKCERDPKCIQKQRGNDCWTQCADDPACVDRCSEITTQSGQADR